MQATNNPAMFNVTIKEKEILRSLAVRCREIADLPEMQTRKKLWQQHNTLNSAEPMILAYPEGAWGELIPLTKLQCQNKILQKWEMILRQNIYQWEHIKDDHILEPIFKINWHSTLGNYGIETSAPGKGHIAAPPLKDLTRDFALLKYRDISVDKAFTINEYEFAEKIFGDILPPHFYCALDNWALGLASEAIKLIGMESFMSAMYERPDELHHLLYWLRDEHLHYLKWFEQEGLLTSNQDYVGSGGVGLTPELPLKDKPANHPVRLKDLWGFQESQETTLISPEMFAKFIFPYQLSILKEFGLNCYGCCEPLEKRLDYILTIPNLRRISVSPWADQQIIAEKLGRKYIFSRKPNPALVCLDFQEAAIRQDLQNTLRLAGNGVLEIILRDTTSLRKEPWRINRWVEIAREEVEEYLLAKT